MCRSLAEKMNKGKKTNVKPFMVKNYLSVFINCMIENPAFDSQAGPHKCTHLCYLPTTAPVLHACKPLGC